MAQRVLAENAGVESVRYVLPNKHYIPVDMKYIGVDNTTPYAFEFNFWDFDYGDYSKFGKRHLPRVVEQKMMGDATGCSFSSIGSRVTLVDLLRRESGSTDAYPFPIFFSLIPDRMRRFSPQWTRQGERERRVESAE
jgi:hypothetical protein